MGFIILGGGLAGLSLAHCLSEESVVLEREKEPGGLCRSFDLNSIKYDIGPHILFSKNKEILEKFTSLTDTNVLKRSNKILHQGKLVKYPFENGLSSLDRAEKEYCLKEFLNNPYENYEAGNMLQFFLKTFGEGITRLYLQPYNEKIWKFDPACMDTQMVERIPKPPKQDIIDSANGIETEGYTHQLYFHYPKSGGTQQIISSLTKLLAGKARIINPVEIKKIYKSNDYWKVETDIGDFVSDKIVNCMPLHELFNYMDATPETVRALEELKYNSIHIIALQARQDAMGNNFALNIADKNIIFHRLSKINFLGDRYCLKNGGSTIMAEVTYRPHSYLAGLTQEEIKDKVLDGLEKLRLVNKPDVLDIELRSFKYAYVIYDLNHRRNADHVLNYLKNKGILCCGRFAEFEYLNMDGVVGHSFKLAQRLNGEQ